MPESNWATTRYGLVSAARAVLSAGVLTGCSVLSAPALDVVPKDQAEKIVKERIELSSGNRAGSIVCDGPLDARVGATQQCAETSAGTKADITLTVTNVEGAKVDFRYQIDDRPLP